MRVILSRKGFDSGSGGCPSPLVSGEPLSLPIPSDHETPTTYGMLPRQMGALVESLTRGRRHHYTQKHWCHLDPDLDPLARPRRPGWRAGLGQVRAAQGHLHKQGVSPDDLFLFWGLFQPVEPSAGDSAWRYCGVREHRVFGWLQIGEVLPVGNQPQRWLQHYPWLDGHPHLHGDEWHPSNTVYIARKRLRLAACRTDVFLPERL
jgi:hypothetical protein